MPTPQGDITTSEMMSPVAAQVEETQDDLSTVPDGSESEQSERSEESK